MSIIFKDFFRTAQETLSVEVIKTNLLSVYKEIIVVCFEIRTKRIITSRGGGDSIFGHFKKRRKLTIVFAVALCQSAWKITAPNKIIFIKFCI
jgi:hypothetical protein